MGGHRRRSWLVLLLGLLLLAACAGPGEPGDGASPSAGRDEAGDGATGGQPPPAGEDEPQPGDDPGQSQGAGIGMDRPETAEATILLEGMEEFIPVRLFVTPAGWPLQFSTYHPDAWVAETETGADGQVVRFTVNYEGQRNDDAYLEVIVHPAGTAEDEARQRVAALAEERGLAEMPDGDERRQPWSLAEYATVSPAFEGVALGRHGDGWFHVHWHYPHDHADGFEPRRALIFREWIWADTGTPLDPGK